MPIKLTSKQISYIWPVVGTIILLIGLVSRFLSFLEKKDKKGWVQNVNERVSETEDKVERKVAVKNETQDSH